MERVESIKFLGVLQDENLSWKDHIKYIENKVVKKFGFLYRVKLYLDKNSLLYTILFVYSHLYKLSKFIVGQYKQDKSKKTTQSKKHAVRIIKNRTRLDHANKLFKLQKY